MTQKTQIQLTKYVIENQERFYRLAYSHTRERESALDMVQNAIVKALEHMESLRSPEYLETWFYRILLNECYGYLRTCKRELAWDSTELDRLRDRDPIQGRDLDLYQQVATLPVPMRTVLILRFYEDMSLKEIATITKTGLSAVKYRLYAGLKRLEQEMREENS